MVIITPIILAIYPGVVVSFGGVHYYNRLMLGCIEMLVCRHKVGMIECYISLCVGGGGGVSVFVSVLSMYTQTDTLTQTHTLTHTHTHTNTHTHTQTHTDRQTHTQTHKHTHIHP